ncbi:MAG: hypothetical protein MK008_05335 [Bdellovibrionales bacterium]|nr:hypothetical protein [Bdellovibrionales bacterium]
MRVLFIFVVLFFQTLKAEVKPTVSFSADQIQSLTIQTDNDLAFHSKLELIENAQKSIKMVYYIYNNDYTSAFFTEKLLQAVERGVKVEILLDYMTNYSRLDLYSMIERQARIRAFKTGSKGSLEFRFYGRPSKSLILTAGLITTGCGSKLTSTESPNECSDAKLKKIDEQYYNGANGSTIAWENKYNVMNRQILKSGMFLSGLYGQNIDVLALATQDLQDNIEEQFSSTEDSQELTEEDKEGLKQFFSLIWDSVQGDNIFVRTLAKIKLAMAYTFMSEDINPISNVLNGLIPIKAENSQAFQSVKDTRFKDLDHFTDYTHHKLLLVDGKSFQLGGRNIEDSYHVAKPNHTLTTKYLFMDTDAVVKLHRPSQKMIQSFDRLFHYTRLTANLDEIRRHAPNDVLANLEHIKKICNNESECMKNAFNSKKHFKSLSQRMNAIEKDFKSYVSTYKKIKSQDLNQKLGVNSKDQYLASPEKLTNHNLHFTSKDLIGTQIDYLENLHFDTDKIKTAQQAQALTTKSYGTPRALSTKNSHKSIHASVYDSIEKACNLSREENREVPVVIHNAYFAPPAGMLQVFSKLSQGEWKCPKLSLEILTNSVDTTDLAIINIFGRRSISTFLNAHENYKNKYSSQITYKEYVKSSNSNKKVKHSLHSKVFVMGDDVIVGSANTDYRSYVMDTNNAISIKNSSLVSQRYMQHYRQIPQNIEDKTQEYVNLKSTQNIPSQLLEPYQVSLENAGIFADKNAPIELIDTLDHAYFEKAIEEFNIEHELFTPKWQAEVKLAGIKLLKMVDDRTYSVITKWGKGHEHYKHHFETDLKLCMQNHQPITRKRCEQKLLRGIEWPAFFQRREHQRRNDAQSLDNLFKYL